MQKQLGLLAARCAKRALRIMGTRGFWVAVFATVIFKIIERVILQY
ncbi:hypothetical protein [Paenibacillus sp. CGMCC 1.18879]|nr:hypothetical protein [Paenibacillus sp. CGMCC 1.18879]MBY9077989.1 hypothetical protein [Paenibacillus sp. CGMCC 1.18879]